MNWELAKNWLIVAFLILDLILGWQVVQSRKELVGYVESYSDLLANTKTILAEHGFSLDTTPPAQHPDVPFLHADYSSPSLPTLMQTSFPKNPSYAIDEDTGTARTTDGVLKLVDKGTWVVQYDDPPLLSSNNPTDYLNFAWQGSNYAYESTVSTQTNNGPSKPSLVAFAQKYGSFWIFDSEVSMAVSNGKLLGYQQTSLSNMYAIGDAKPTISALDALDSLANSVDKSMQRIDNKVLSIQLGYIHKVPQNPNSSSSLAAPNYWFPAWRIITSQQTYYINAFTGEVDTTS